MVRDGYNTDGRPMYTDLLHALTDTAAAAGVCDVCVSEELGNVHV